MIEFFGDVGSWLGDADNWTGTNGLLWRTWQHIYISALGITIGAVLALPLATVLGHLRRGGILAVSAVNVGRALPSFGLVAIAFPISLSLGLSTPLGFWATLFGLVALAMPPMFVNGYTAISEVEPALVETARGMGMTEREVLTAVELPVGLPVLMAGVRVAAVQVVATATLGAWVGFNALGRYIFAGFQQRDNVILFVGGLSVAILVLLTELSLGWVERRVDPTGRRRRVGPVDDADLEPDPVTPP